MNKKYVINVVLDAELSLQGRIDVNLMNWMFKSFWRRGYWIKIDRDASIEGKILKFERKKNVNKLVTLGFEKFYFVSAKWNT